jgi:hypothetical protein
MFQKILGARIKELWNLYEATGELNHPGEKGLLREIFVRRLVESVLPPHYGVGSGVVVDKWGRQSPQIDLLVFDRRRMPPIFEEHGHGIYPLDAVLRVIEVKRLLDRLALDQFKKTIDAFNPKNTEGLKLAAAGKLEEGWSYYPLCIMFAYKTNLGNLSEAIAQSNLESHAAMIFVATKGIKNSPVISLEQTARLFLGVLLGAIEESAASRKEFSILEWIF